MTRREQLVEAYEDAYFELLMDDVAEMEGAYWEAFRKELENDPSAVVPEPVDRRCMKTMERCFARRKRQKNLRIARKVLNRIAVFAGIVSLLFTTVLAVSEEARAATANLLIMVNDRYTELHMEPGGAEHESADVPADGVLKDGYFTEFKVGWIPDGFYFVNGTPNILAEFENDKGLSFTIDYVSGYSSYQVDTENADSVDYIEINGYQVLKIIKDGMTNMALINKEKSCIVGILTSDGIPPDTAMKLVENILFI